MLKFGEYLPDVAPLENQGLVVAKNLLPGSTGYLPLPAPAQISDNEIDARFQGGFSATSADSSIGSVFTFVGTVDKLYSFDAASFTDVSRVAGYATGDEETWEFAQWGNQVVATNFSDEMQVVSMGSPPFADLAGTPPKARHIGVVDNFLVAGNTWDSVDGFRPYRVRWAGIGSIVDWTVSATTQADFQDLRNDAGAIQKVIGGEFGLVFQERAITRMSYIGSPLVFQFDEIESERGALAPNSVIKVGSDVAFLSQDGFYWFNGQESIPIGDGKIDQTFFDDFEITYLDRMSVDLYPNENIIIWSYVSKGSTNGMPDTMLFYNYSPQSVTRWTFAKILHWGLISPISQSYTLDGLDAVSTNLDTGIVFSLDSRVWMGFVNLLAIINADLGLSLINGPAMDATIETGEAWLEDPNRTFITLIRPHIDKAAGTVTAQIATRNLESENLTYGPICSLNSAGYIPVRANARFMRAQFNITGQFNIAQGFDIISATRVGRR